MKRQLVSKYRHIVKVVCQHVALVSDVLDEGV